MKYSYTKYRIEWQIFRANVKGKETSLSKKLNYALQFLEQNSTLANWYRIINWLEGLKIAYKDPIKIQDIQETISNLQWIYSFQRASLIDQKETQVSSIEDMKKYSLEDRLVLLKDLFKRNQKWVSKGYVQKELNDFLDNLYHSFDKEEEAQIPYQYSYFSYQKVLDSKPSKNTHRFIY